MTRLDLSAVDLESLLGTEWLCVNGAGGYASSTPAGLNTRKYHGLLVAAMAPPVRRMVLLSRIEETVHSNGWPSPLSCNEYPGAVHPQGHTLLRGFCDEPHPRWIYEGDGWQLEKELRMVPGANTVCVTYSLLTGQRGVRLEIKPLFALRGIHELMYQWTGQLDACLHEGCLRIPPTSRTPEVFMAHDGIFCADSYWYLNTIYRREEERGYAGLEDVWMPGAIRFRLMAGQQAHFVCSADPIDLSRTLESLREDGAQYRSTAVIASADLPDPLAALRRSVDQFVLRETPESTRGMVPGFVSGYPWDAPRTRDVLIGFAGLYLIPGRLEQGRQLLLQLAASLKDGLIPSEFAEDGSGPAYRSADVSLWFVQALSELVRYGVDRKSLASLFEKGLEIVEAFRAGAVARAKIGADGLLAIESPGSTWMEAVGRPGMPVEVNALWYNALRVVAGWAEELGKPRAAAELSSLAESAQIAFNRRFWNEAGQYCFDGVSDNGVDFALRPNQLLALSLTYPVLELQRHAAVLGVMKRELLTPVGIRTLGRSESAYRGYYRGDASARDRILHNGPAFPWLLGAYVDGLMHVHGRSEAIRGEARQLLDGCLNYINQTGQLPQLFDGEAPHRAGGTPCSALSAAEVLRAYHEHVLDHAPLPASTGRVIIRPILKDTGGREETPART